MNPTSKPARGDRGRPWTGTLTPWRGMTAPGMDERSRSSRSSARRLMPMKPRAARIDRRRRRRSANLSDGGTLLPAARTAGILNFSARRRARAVIGHQGSPSTWTTSGRNSVRSRVSPLPRHRREAGSSLPRTWIGATLMPPSAPHSTRWPPRGQSAGTARATEQPMPSSARSLPRWDGSMASVEMTRARTNSCCWSRVR